MKPSSSLRRCGLIAACLFTFSLCQAQNSGESNTMYVAYATDQNGVAFGTCEPMTVRVFPNNSGRAAVGVLQEFSGGTGNMWNTAAWIAAFNSSNLNNTSIIDHEFIIRVGGHVDGPSAGMLTTVAMLAAMRGDEMRDDTTMTGTINPDGTAGPVGGIPQKIEGAKAKGKTRFGFPVGARSSLDSNTGEMVDMIGKADSMDMEAREIRDVYEAYEFLTGKKLPRPEKAYEGDLDIPASLRTKVQGWSLKTKGELEARVGPIFQLAQQDEGVAASFGMMLQAINQEYEDGARFEQSGMPVAAYYKYLTSDAMARAIEITINSLGAVASGDMQVLVNQLNAVQNQNDNKLGAFQLQARASLTNTSLGGRVDALNNMSTFAQAYAYFQIGIEEHQQFVNIAENLEQFSQQVGAEAATQQLLMKFLMSSLYYKISGTLVDFAEDWVSLASSQGPEVDVTAEQYEALARAYASAGSSCVAYFDAVVTEPTAQQLGVPVAQFAEQLSMTEGMYRPTKMVSTFSEIADRFYQTPDAMENAYFKLGAGSAAYLNGASLVNKWYSLNPQFQEDGSIVLGNQRAVGVMLDRAKERALEEAGQINEKFGFIPDSVKLNFQLATALREGDNEDKLQALQIYWTCAFLCDVARAMAGEK